MEKNTTLRVGIIGAGPSGLTLAYALSKRANVHVTVFEKGHDHRKIPSYNPLRSYTIDITGHGARAVEPVSFCARCPVGRCDDQLRHRWRGRGAAF